MKKTNTHENQLILPFGQRRGAAISYDNRLRVFWTLVAISIISLAVYIYAINTTARNIALRYSLEREVARIQANLDSLEFAYIAMRNDITIELAYERGFTEAKRSLFVFRAATPALSLNTSGR